MIGPAVLRYLQGYFTRYNPSVDAIFTILQVRSALPEQNNSSPDLSLVSSFKALQCGTTRSSGQKHAFYRDSSESGHVPLH